MGQSLTVPGVFNSLKTIEDDSQREQKGNNKADGVVYQHVFVSSRPSSSLSTFWPRSTSPKSWTIIAFISPFNTPQNFWSNQTRRQDISSRIRTMSPCPLGLEPLFNQHLLPAIFNGGINSYPVMKKCVTFGILIWPSWSNWPKWATCDRFTSSFTTMSPFLPSRLFWHVPLVMSPTNWSVRRKKWTARLMTKKRPSILILSGASPTHTHTCQNFSVSLCKSQHRSKFSVYLWRV